MKGNSIQIAEDSETEECRIKIWNLVNSHFIDKLNQWQLMDKSHKLKIQSVCDKIWTEYLNQDIDDIHPFKTHQYGINFFQDVRTMFNLMTWLKIFKLVQNLSVLDEKQFDGTFADKLNTILEKEKSKYRLVKNKIIKVLNPVELDSIQEATSEKNLKPVVMHLNSALTLLVNKENPDYRNSIKESISAVEAICSSISEKENASLGEALSILDKTKKIHPAQKKAFLALYGYTSDANGIRHNLKDTDDELFYDDAKFMLVSCTAFINFLQSKHLKS